MGGYNPAVPTNNNKGFWNANTNTPDYAVELTETGHYLIVSIGGTQTIDGDIIVFSEGEYLVKIDSGFSKISPTDPSFTGFTDGDFIKVVDGVATKAGMRQLSDALLATTKLRTEQGSLDIGKPTTLSEYGGLYTVESAITGSKYHPVLTQYTVGTYDLFENNKAKRLEIGTSSDIEVQPTDTTELSNVLSATFTSLAYLHELTKMYFDFAKVLTNFRFRISRADNGEVVKYFPSEFAWIDCCSGMDIEATGKQEVYPLGDTNGTPMLFVASTDYVIDMVANEEIDLNGSTLLPWLKVEVAPAEFVELADKEIVDQFIFPSDGYSTKIGNWMAESISYSDDVSFMFVLPDIFDSIVSAKVMVIPDSSETLTWDVECNSVTTGENYFDNEIELDNETQYVSVNKITELDILDVLTNAAAGDYLAIDFNSDTSNIRVIGLRLKYSVK